MTFATDSGKFPLTSVHVLPKSLLIKRCVAKLSSRYALSETNTVASSCGDGETLLTHLFCGNPPLIFVQVPPASLLINRFPSSVPAYNSPNFKGDSANVEIVDMGTLPD